ncbi:Transposon Ty3-I Gag-Pol polyprotein [Araneus ventricosus]|uniref:RNA-directed DNA polymerase n=1 Tax=Araneus ventricosus TaxID=182803 RepID=A0A4Y2BTJ2_ARAVE|nr:Transposon Ty3-I Gag-Pol polyprotein [Araneus ventricosus]
MQDIDESFDAFYTDLRKLVKSCEFENQADSVIRDRIVLGIDDSGLQERLLREGNLSLARAAEICRDAELSKKQAQTVKTKSVDALQKKKFQSARFNRAGGNQQQRQTANNKSDAFSGGTSRAYAGVNHRMYTANNDIGNASGADGDQRAHVTNNNNVYICKKCNRKHRRSECPAFGKQCFVCGNYNHFSVVCQMRSVQDVICITENKETEPYVVTVVQSDFLLTLFFLKSVMSSRRDHRAAELKTGLHVLSFLYDFKKGPERDVIDFCIKMDVIAKIFQKRNEANFSDIPGVLVYFDDLLTAGDTIEQHDEILGKVIKRAKELNIKFNQNKIQLKVPEVKYLGYIFSSEGMKPDPDYVQAIIDMPEPRNKTELQRILGMINYLRQFIPQASTISAPLRELLKKSTVWHWLPVHETTLKTLKYKIASTPVFSVFNSSKSIVIQADSSKDGLGCCLLQDGRPVAFASRSLTEIEKGYAQIEKEFLSIVFAVTKFHYFIYGRQVEVLTDHKPLVSIMSKNVADLLSRAYIVKPLKDDIEMTELVHSLTKHLQISESRKKEFKEATLSDVGLSHVLKFWNEGWPSNGQNISPEAWEYFKFRDNIYVEEGLVFLNDRIIVPVSLRSEMLNILHQAHCGMEKARARQVLFWPGITKDIENMVSKCKTCERYRPRNVKEPLICHEVPNLPYEKIGTDISEHGGKSYLIIGCYLSKWLDIIKLSNKTSDEIIANLKEVFSTHGIPKIIVCDNMPFASIKMKKFSREWGFEIVNSSPRYAKIKWFC